VSSRREVAEQALTCVRCRREGAQQGYRVADAGDDGAKDPKSGTIFDPVERWAFVVAARNALSVASTSLFILEREIPKSARSHKVSKHLARIDRHLAMLAKLIGAESPYLRP
jgi:hypothetical protein